jgi:hypothetical protein
MTPVSAHAVMKRKFAMPCSTIRTHISNRATEGRNRSVFHFILKFRDNDGGVFVLHNANRSSGGTSTKIELGDFLAKGKAGPEHQALALLIGGLVEHGDQNDGKP